MIVNTRSSAARVSTCAGAEAFLTKPLGAREVAHLWQYMKTQRLPEGSFRRDVESSRFGTSVRDSHFSRAGAVESSAGVEQGDRDTDYEVDVSAFEAACQVGMPSCAAVEPLPHLSELVPRDLSRSPNPAQRRYAGSRSPSAFEGGPALGAGVPRTFTDETTTSKQSGTSAASAVALPDLEAPIGANCAQQ